MTDEDVYVVFQRNLERLSEHFPYSPASWADVAIAVARERERHFQEAFRSLLCNMTMAELAQVGAVAERELFKARAASASITPPPAPPSPPAATTSTNKPNRKGKR